jgi:hypothetical protein
VQRPEPLVVLDRRPHHRAQHLGLERLDQVVVRAGIDPLDDLLAVAGRSLHDHRHGGQSRVSLDPLEQLHAAHPRHSAVEHDHVIGVGVGLEPCPGVMPVPGGLDLETGLLEVLEDQLDAHRIVVDHENPRPASGHLCAPAHYTTSKATSWGHVEIR